MIKTIAWICGIGAMIFLCAVYQQSNRKKLIVCKLCADICWVSHYLCLGALGGAIPNFVGIFRELVFVRRGKKAWADAVWWPVLFITLNFALGLFTFRSPINLLPIGASAFVTVSLWCKNPRMTKAICAPVSAAFLIYDVFVGSWVGVFNESISLVSIAVSFIRSAVHTKEEITMNTTETGTIFTPDVPCEKPGQLIDGQPVNHYAAILSAEVSAEVKTRGDRFSEEIRSHIIADFEKAGTDRMVHVSTFLYTADTIYMTYYANTSEGVEDPRFQTARLVRCPINNPDDKTFLDIQSVGDSCYDGTVDMVYDTILMQKDEKTLLVLWTASVSGKYYRLYRAFDLQTKQVGPVGVNRFKVGDTINDFSTSGIPDALRANGIGVKTMYSDIGIMQKLSSRTENGRTVYYTGTYSGDFNCIIRSSDLITWEYVSQPDFKNESKWENAVYVLDDRCFYFVRQQDGVKGGFLTVYHLNEHTWETPVLVEDCQSRGDFIIYEGQLYLFHAPVDREHIGIVKINTNNLADSRIVLQADMQGSCFYPFVQYGNDGELRMSYTVDRQHIRLARFTLRNYL